MSPLPLRRYRAERLLRREFEGQRERVLGAVRGRLRSRGVSLDDADLEACYATAWQGLYTALLEGEEIENPAGWLVQVCFRRAIDEARARARRQEHPDAADGPHGLSLSVEPDMAGTLDNSLRLRHTFEGLRTSLSARERQAATLCYLQGLSRAEAASRMGVSEARMRKLMEGRGPERPGVAAKMDGLLRTIGGGGWCEQQGSLMRALAFGILDPKGERYRLAQLHRRECPACRAYIVSLRGLAAVLPPLALPWGPGAVGFGSGAAAGAGAGGGAAGTGAGAGASAAPGAAGLGGAAGGGAAGSWLPLGGSLGAKLAAGCLLVAGVGGGCVALIAPAHTKRPAHRHALVLGAPGAVEVGALPGAIGLAGSLSDVHAANPGTARSAPSRPRRSLGASPAAATTAALRAQRELGFERAAAPVVAVPRIGPTARPSSLSPSSTSPSGAARGPAGAAGHEFGIE
jgi:RNA polymerase sigma factor (sigma-70 family)